MPFLDLGNFSWSRAKPPMGCNPATGEEIKIPAKTVVKMRVAKAAKEEIVRGKVSPYKAEGLKINPNRETSWGVSFKIPRNEFFSLHP